MEKFKRYLCVSGASGHARTEKGLVDLFSWDEIDEIKNVSDYDGVAISELKVSVRPSASGAGHHRCESVEAHDIYRRRGGGSEDRRARAGSGAGGTAGGVT